MSNFDKPVNRWDTNSLKWDVSRSELPMWVADMDFQVAKPIQEAIMKKVELGIYGYSIIPEEFFDSFINWWKTRHNYTFEREWMLYSSGIVAAISSIVRKLTTPAEKVLVMSPTFNIFYNCIYNNGRYIETTDLQYKNGKYSLDFNDLENKLADPQLSLLILCNPHNPIGKIWSKTELAKIGHLCKENNVIVISDEIHCDIVTPGLSYVPFASVNEECRNNSITCLAASKTFNLAGLQSACLVIPNKLLRHRVNRGLNTDEVAEPNAFSMEANIAALKYGASWVDEMLEYVYQNKLLFVEYLQNNLPKLQVVSLDATYLLWVYVGEYTSDGTYLCEFIRQKSGLVLSPGEEFGANGRPFFRINLATSRSNVLDALNRLKKSLNLFVEAN